MSDIGGKSRRELRRVKKQVRRRVRRQWWRRVMPEARKHQIGVMWVAAITLLCVWGLAVHLFGN
jgi:hypothetical protein